MASPAATTAFTYKLLCLSPLRQFGRMSYAYFILHWPVYQWCAWVVAAQGLTAEAVPTRDGNGKGWFFFSWYWLPILLVLILCVASIAHYCFERPIQRWAERVLNDDELRPRVEVANENNMATLRSEPLSEICE
jgi:peptidoglycan/LPS O-acetylase OafA/YrhL